MRSSGLMIVGEPDDEKRVRAVNFTLIARALGTRELPQRPPLPERPFLLHVPACCVLRLCLYALSQCAVDAAYQRNSERSEVGWPPSSPEGQSTRVHNLT